MDASSIEDPAHAAAECARLAQAFVAHLDMQRYEAVGALFASDGIMQRVSGEVLQGPAEIARSLRRPSNQRVIHHASPVHVELTGPDKATGVSSFLAFVATPDDGSATVRIAALWHDRYRRERGEWRIAERRVDVRMRTGLP